MSLGLRWISGHALITPYTGSTAKSTNSNTKAITTLHGVRSFPESTGQLVSAYEFR